MRHNKNQNGVNLRNATLAQFSNSSGTIVAAGANTNGLIIHYADISTGDASSGGQMNVGGVIILSAPGGGESNNNRLENVFVPAGNAVTYVCGSANVVLGIGYEVL